MAILLITLYPKDSGPTGEQNINLILFKSMAEMIANAVSQGVPLRNIGLNILLFVPFGFQERPLPQLDSEGNACLLLLSGV